MNSFLSHTYADLNEVASQNRKTYINSEPFPHIKFDNFFNASILDEVLKEFPDLSKGDVSKHIHDNSIKITTRGSLRFGRNTLDFVNFLNSEIFLNFLGDLTSLERPLISDPYFWGGGFHEIKQGGFLKIHADFNKHKNLGLDRRLNVLVYLNKKWKKEYGGHLELWNKDMTSCIKKISPDFNTVVIFSTTDESYHGHPDYLKCPPEMSRKSLALYYYTNGRPTKEINEGLESHGTIYKARKGYSQDDKKHMNSVASKISSIPRMILPPIIYQGIKKILKN